MGRAKNSSVQRGALSEEGEASGGEDPTVEEYPVDPEIGDYDPATRKVQCKVCDRPMKSKEQFRDHLKGQKHNKKYEKAQRLKAQREAQAAQASTAVTPLLTVRTVTCTSAADGAVQLWGAYVPAVSYQ